MDQEIKYNNCVSLNIECKYKQPEDQDLDDGVPDLRLVLAAIDNDIQEIRKVIGQIINVINEQGKAIQTLMQGNRNG